MRTGRDHRRGVAQHSSMNIADKERLYQEIHRVLRPGGRLALHEILAGPTSPIHFPVPWARDPSISHLQPPETIRALIPTTGFTELVWVDETASATQSFQQRPPPRPPDAHHSACPCCSAPTSARCSVTRCATSKSTGSTSSRPSSNALTTLLSGIIPNKTLFRGLALLQALP